ncbi:hypothetical protein [Paraburkholderia sp. J12]|uniref:hypothetical protein n=1 Tax=Paraburkholderia sp. J12 TaxID=2805432 RepID=UPI002ABE3C29|nr:hypothetical protein [Paraburkholderia sp. J12]
MTKQGMIRLARGLLVAAIGAFALAGCASLQPTADGPGNCVGPPDFCTPYFGS